MRYSEIHSFRTQLQNLITKIDINLYIEEEYSRLQKPLSSFLITAETASSRFLSYCNIVRHADTLSSDSVHRICLAIVLNKASIWSNNYEITTMLGEIHTLVSSFLLQLKSQYFVDPYTEASLILSYFVILGLS